MPTPGREDVLPELDRRLEQAIGDSQSRDRAVWLSDLRRLLADRAAAGRRKYGTPLQTFNGRQGTRDSLDEAADLCMYMMQVAMEYRDMVVSSAEALEILDDAINVCIRIYHLRQTIGCEELY